MPPTIQTTEPVSHAPFAPTPPAAQPGHASPIYPPALREAPGFFIPIATTSIAAHLLLVSWFGAGVPTQPIRVVREAITQPPPALIEEVQLLPEPVPPEPQARIDDPAPLIEAPSPAADLDLPPLPEVQSISAVPSSVAVSFGITVNGPVRLVSDAANASGAISGRRTTGPVSLDSGSSHDLLLTPLSYPPRAKRQRLTGTVSIEFRANPTGEIYDVRVRESSGHEILDDAALENLKSGRWKGRPGFYVKAFEFSLL